MLVCPTGPILAAVAGLALMLAGLGAPATAHGRVLDLGSGAWSWFADPRAIHHEGRKHQTYVGWVDRAGRVNVASYDRRGQQTRTVLKRFKTVDDHDNPALLMLPDGRVAAFYSHHQGATMAYRVSKRPEDVSEFGRRFVLPTNTRGRHGFTYPNPIRLGERIWVFWRGGNWNPSFTTKDPGGPWAPARTLIRAPGHRPYAKFASDGRRTIAVAFTDGHPRERNTNLYFAKLRGGRLYGAGGRRIGGGLPIRPGQANRIHSFKRSKTMAWVHDVALTRSGRPVVVYATFRTGRRHLYWYAVWTGRRWARHLMVRAGGPITRDVAERFYSGGLTLDHTDPRTVYLSRKAGTHHQVERWRAIGGGKRWALRRLTRSRTSHVRPITPRGLHRGEREVLWMRGSYGAYRRFRTSIFSSLGVSSAPPRASFSVRRARRRLSFDAAPSARGSSPIALRRWDFGDGTAASGRRATHRFRRPGTYFPRLTVTDAAGLRSVLAIEVQVR